MPGSLSYDECLCKRQLSSIFQTTVREIEQGLQVDRSLQVDEGLQVSTGI